MRFWVVANEEGWGPYAFTSEKAARHWLDHRVEGWWRPDSDPLDTQGWRLYVVKVESEVMS